MIKDSYTFKLTLLSSVLCIMIVLVNFSIYDAIQENLILLRINAHFSTIDCPAEEKFVVECVHRHYCAPTASPMSFVLSFSSSIIQANGFNKYKNLIAQDLIYYKYIFVLQVDQCFLLDEYQQIFLNMISLLYFILEITYFHNCPNCYHLNNHPKGNNLRTNVCFCCTVENKIPKQGKWKVVPFMYILSKHRSKR